MGAGEQEQLFPLRGVVFQRVVKTRYATAIWLFRLGYVSTLITWATVAFPAGKPRNCCDDETLIEEGYLNRENNTRQHLKR